MAHIIHNHRAGIGLPPPPMHQPSRLNGTSGGASCVTGGTSSNSPCSWDTDSAAGVAGALPALVALIAERRCVPAQSGYPDLLDTCARDENM